MMYSNLTPTSTKREISDEKRFGEAREAKINAFRGTCLGIGQVPDLTQKQRLAALAAASDALLTGAAGKTAANHAPKHGDLQQGLQAVASYKATIAQAEKPARSTGAAKAAIAEAEAEATA